MVASRERPSPVTVRRSRVQGKGVFATRDFAQGERIIEYKGALVTQEETDSLCDDESMRRHHTFLFAVDDRYVIDGSRGGNESRYINHSCEPNAESVIVGRRVFIHAAKDIARGQEVLYDYWYVVDDCYTMEDLQRIYPCNCRAKQCRGTLARPPRRRKRAASSRT